MADSSHCTVIENAVGIVRLRLSGDEWARSQGEKMLSTWTTEALIKQILHSAASLLAEVSP